MGSKTDKENLDHESNIPALFKENVKEWLCETCGFVLGYSDPNKNVIRIKYKDLYLWIEGGRVSNICRRCGAINELIDSNYKKYLEGKEVIQDV